MSSAHHENEHPVFERTHQAEQAMALSAIDCALNGDRGLYASSEITTGRRLNALLRRHGLTSASELRHHLGQAEFERRIVEPNIARACRFAHELRERFRGVCPVLTPGPFNAPGWSQRQYLAFWEELIRTRTQAVHFNHGWQYSSGCTFEFWVAVHAGVSTFAADGTPLTAADGARLMRRAAAATARAGLGVATIHQNLAATERLL